MLSRSGAVEPDEIIFLSFFMVICLAVGVAGLEAPPALSRSLVSRRARCACSFPEHFHTGVGQSHSRVPCAEGE
jgi:hypothetical protein